MISNVEKSPLYPILNPRSIAFWGASNHFASMGTNQLASLKALGFEGRIYPVHPKETDVLGLRAYKSAMDLPEVPDLAILVLPTDVVPEVMEQCGEKGIQHAIVVSGGFREVGSGGAHLENRVLDIAQRHEMRFLGPNCIGVANPHHKLNTTFMPHEGFPGFVGMASQSGSFITQMFNYLFRRGMGFSAGISVGNEADIDLVDCMEYLAVCPHTRVIALYIEAVRRGRAFIDAARAVVPHKPIVAVYVGGSEAGRRASLSHTGALAGPDSLYDGAFRQSGVIRAESMEELFDYCMVLGQAHRPKGKKVVIQTHSGGPGTVAADACSRAGLELPSLSLETRRKLSTLVPRTGSAGNPVDITYSKNPLDYFLEIPRHLLESDEADGLLVYFLVPSHTVARVLEQSGSPGERARREAEHIIQEQCRLLAGLVNTSDKPLLGFSLRDRRDLFIRELQDRGVPVLASPERAARAMAALVRYAKVRELFDTGDAGFSEKTARAQNDRTGRQGNGSRVFGKNPGQPKC